MKKALIISVSILFSVWCWSEQTVAQILVGAKAGPTWGVFSIDNQGTGVSNSYLLGFMCAGIVEINITEMISVEVEPGFVQKTSTVNFPPSWTKLHLSYLQLPVVAKRKVWNGPISLSVLLGPDFGVLLAATGKTNLLGETREWDVKQDYATWDLAIDGGIECDYEMSPRVTLRADLRYSLGVYNIDRTNTGRIRTRGIQLTVGTMFNI